MAAGAIRSATDRAAALWREDPRWRIVLAFAALVALCVPLNVAIQLAEGLSVLRPLQVWLLENALVTDDSWRPMGAAYEWVKTGPDGSLYQEIFFERRYKFQYAPTSLIPYAALEAIGVAPTPLVFNIFNRVFLLVGALGLGAIAWILIRRAQPERADPALPAVAALVVAGASFLYFPLTYGYLLGQAQVWNNTLFILACLAWLFDRRMLAGVLIGLACLIKPQLAVLGLWGLLRRDWRFVAGLAGIGVAGLALSVPLFGWRNHIAYLDVLSYISRHGEAHLSNHAPNGLIHRIVGNDSGLTWSNEAFAPYNPVVYVATLISSLALLVVGLWPRRTQGATGGLMQLLFATIAITLASPLTWEPHLGVMAPALVVLFCLTLAMPAGKAKRDWLAALALVFVVSANHFPFVRVFAGTPLLVLQSYLLFAGLAIMAMLWRLGGARRASEPRPAGESA